MALLARGRGFQQWPRSLRRLAPPAFRGRPERIVVELAPQIQRGLISTNQNGAAAQQVQWWRGEAAAGAAKASPGRVPNIAAGWRSGLLCRSMSSAPEYSVVNMPALSPTMEAGTVVSWTKKPGDFLAAGDVLCEVETDKATVSFEVQDDGVLAKILVAGGGAEVKVGQPVAVTVEDAEAYAAFVKAEAAGEISMGDDAAAPAKTAAASAPAAAADGASSAENEAAAATAPFAERTVAEQFLLTPAARHMSHSRGVDATGLRGSGRDGRVTKSDVVMALKCGVELPPLRHAAAATGAVTAAAAAAAPVPAAVASAAHAAAPVPAAAAAARAAALRYPEIMTAEGGFTDIPANNVRKVIAKRLTESRASVPHVFVSIECEIDALLALRKKLQKEHDVKVSVNDVIIRSAGLALRDVPEANAKWTKKGVEMSKAIDISVAVATPSGLITPIVPAVDRMGLSTISAKVRDLASRARDNKLKPEEFMGGSFTISNLGMFGIDEFSAVINPPQACIMAVGGGAKVLRPGAPASEPGGTRAPPRVATVMTARLSCDRRVMDEALAGQFLQAVRHYMERPELLLM